MGRGRPSKYSSDEERKKVFAEKARNRYLSKVGVVRGYNIDASAERYRGTKAYRLYHGCKTRAKKNSLPFDLDVEFLYNLLEESKICPLLNVPYDDELYLQSVDKLIPELGYTKDNVWIISYRANSIKNNATLTELELITKNLKSRLS